eukprot:CAMPEP_0174377926 /NCGR_PEP_ID=MMETSP0811_2-20130205/121737_1 /TAXON_ID=73025 ORGANISM="Eutreptiella gymnastica-like, Strain CCMP1594" /NCGR_SAMPLE_ID=MMETSP0811_2 /ASSEMBLY_ACC=CAM_ASM_000667 /LENGTH=152 /DNA_ID=CAMNT_0015530029 /DNA_START=50 /DNA_END=508 /DNA_ORIENTATION=+
MAGDLEAAAAMGAQVTGHALNAEPTTLHPGVCASSAGLPSLAMAVAMVVVGAAGAAVAAMARDLEEVVVGRISARAIGHAPAAKPTTSHPGLPASSAMPPRATVVTAMVAVAEAMAAAAMARDLEVAVAVAVDLEVAVAMFAPVTGHVPAAT